jgi:DNA-directed RNA polymerase subunit RPC12/RpoP
MGLSQTDVSVRCPYCRDLAIRRRQRTGLWLYVASFFGMWPYQCEDCGEDFLLGKRYVRYPSRAGMGQQGGDAGGNRQGG